MSRSFRCANRALAPVLKHPRQLTASTAQNQHVVAHIHVGKSSNHEKHLPFSHRSFGHPYAQFGPASPFRGDRKLIATTLRSGRFARRAHRRSDRRRSSRHWPDLDTGRYLPVSTPIFLFSLRPFTNRFEVILRGNREILCQPMPQHSCGQNPNRQ